MRTLYIDCSMGAAGDMLTAALLELLPDPEGFIDELNTLGIPEVEYKKETASKCGIAGTLISVRVRGVEEGEEDGHAHAHGQEYHHGDWHGHEHNHGDEHGHWHSHHSHHGDKEHRHTHNGLGDIEHIVRGHLKVSDKLKDDIMGVYTLIAEAESKVHGKPVSEVHFHEVGALDAVADIAAVCLLMERIAPDEVVVSPVHVGSGQVKCAHGIMPVPAPATALILEGVPIYGGSIKGELCTPTGAALLVHFATRFGDMPLMRVSSIGYGMGKKDFEAANCLRVMLGETGDRREEIYEISCTVDDMTGEEIGFATERLFEAGAVDVCTVAVGMKKNRTGMLIQALCREETKESIVHAMFKHTTTIGIRENKLKRYVLERRIEESESPYGTVRRKLSEGYGVSREKFEYDDLSRIAKENDMSLSQVRESLNPLKDRR